MPRATATVLGIETSCDETAASVVRVSEEGVEVLSDIVLSQAAAHAPYRGVVPEIAARAHVEGVDGAVEAAMREAGVTFADLTAVAATAGPGLIGGVMVGLVTGKAIAAAHGLPLMPINHLEGHALSPRLAGALPFPYLLLLISGGHCQFIAVEGLGRYRRLGSTIDDAAGEAFDKTAKALGLDYPGGPALESLAATGDPQRFALPRPMVGRPGCDMSFAGLKTAAARLTADPELAADATFPADLAASFQSAVAHILTERAAGAMSLYEALALGAQARRLVVAGGVAANGAVRAALTALCAERGYAFFAPPLRFCTDNAAMIALAGAERLLAGFTGDMDAPARPRWPLDEAAALASPTHAPGRKGAKA
jgi:N6-L-threonylcarbamoyladenine synthase